ncbi:MAG: hypothetical protein LBF22_04910 [Deltaproteobacteria bacterium]|jgi:predicted Fe-Mo cluster-binding NifX family protein|nr:hypothetical protein [Deltaproteobacteria bacterium]
MANTPSRKRQIFRPQRLAIASLTGDAIDSCFGKTTSFRIYDLVEDGGPRTYQFKEQRECKITCEDKTHNLDVLKETAKLLSDCEMVLAGRIGPAALQELNDLGIMGLAVPLPLEKVLKKLAEN